MSQLSISQIQALLKEDEASHSGRGGPRGPRKDITEPREIGVWMKLPHKVAEFEVEGNTVTPHCENPDCNDPRPHNNRGRNVVAVIKGKMMCRYCFLAGWLSEN